MHSNTLVDCRFLYIKLLCRESEIICEGGRVLVISTPTPGNKRRRELMRQSRCQLGPGELLTPTSSRSSTPARSRNSTPQRNRARPTPVQILTPVHINNLQAIDTFIPSFDSLKKAKSSHQTRATTNRIFSWQLRSQFLPKSCGLWLPRSLWLRTSVA